MNTRLTELDEQIAERKKQVEDLRAELGDALVGTVNGIPAVKVVASQNTHVDKEKLAELAPEVYAQTLVVTPYTYLKAL